VTGSYHMAFVVAGTVSIAGLILTVLLSPTEKS
jgi:hypothetical protein